MQVLKTISFNGKEYPLFQAEGFAAQFAIPFAKHICKGKGYDVGCMKKEWSFPGSIPIDISFNEPWHALNLPEKNVDYIFSSHCLEHLDDWVQAISYWHECLKKDGVLFLYLPHWDQEYWRPWNNRKHKHVLTRKIVTEYMESLEFHNIFSSKRDLNYSFMIIGER